METDIVNIAAWRSLTTEDKLEVLDAELAQITACRIAGIRKAQLLVR
jgi:hypothetical protein